MFIQMGKKLGCNLGSRRYYVKLVTPHILNSAHWLYKFSNAYTDIGISFFHEYMYTDCVLHHHRIIRHCFNYLRTHFNKSAGICKQSK